MNCRQAVIALFLAAVLASASGQVISSGNAPFPNLESNTERPLRYRPDGQDFVINNGGEFFNRPLYGRNTAFRVDAGDQPEFLFYLPGRGGNLRFGIRSRAGAKWLHHAQAIEARYRPGQMLYEIRDPLLGVGAVLRLSAVPMHETDGLVVRIEGEGVETGTSLIYAFGGVNGKRGRRDGDIGTEPVPISEYFQLQPEVCAGDRIHIEDAEASRFVVQGKAAVMLGLLPRGATCAVADAAAWKDPAALADASRGAPRNPIVFGDIPLAVREPSFLALQRIESIAGPATAEELAAYREVSAPRPGGADKGRPAPAVSLLPAYAAEQVPGVLSAAENHYNGIRNRLSIETPDPFINAAVAALNIAADAVWDEPQQGIMHGAIAWRSRLLGWRGPYAMDALGWHERARAHFRYWASRQNTDPVPDRLPPPDENANLARSEAALHSNGDMSNSHYDMNLVAIDALFRHLRWTGDMTLAREMWPVVERHLAWERRLFRREFATDRGEKLPLYEAYAAIWASDDLQYHGGGTAHASAYNFFHNHEAARLARSLGRDPTPYESEAALIARGMREILWLPEQGTFAEFKDLLGRQLVHSSAALWSVYHVIDSELATDTEGYRMIRYVEDRMPRLPVHGPGVPSDAGYSVYASTNWMPYTWSINNVVMGENVHTALAMWQAGRAESALHLMKSALLASMYMGICPGNVGSMNHLDVYRRESQRDFADGSGVLSRSIVEGLFGIKPDALAGLLVLQPGLPVTWSHASINLPAVGYTFSRDVATEQLSLRQSLPGIQRVSLKWPALRERLVGVRVNGEPVEARLVDDELGRAWLTLEVPARPEMEFVISWAGMSFLVSREELDESSGYRPSRPPAAESTRSEAAVERPRYDPVDLREIFNDRVTNIFRPGKYRSPRSPYVSLALPAQGIGAWAGHVNAMAEIDDSGLRALAGANGGRLMIDGGPVFSVPGPGDSPNVVFTSHWDNYPIESAIPLQGRARRVHLLMAGSTNHMQSRIDNGEVLAEYTDGSTVRLALRNPETWWPIEQDYFIDDFQFRVAGPLPTRVDLKTGAVRVLEAETFKGKGGPVEGGAATVLALDLDPTKELRSLSVRALANEVVIGLMAVTIER